MKEVKAVLPPAKLARLGEALRRVPGFPGMTVARLEGMAPPASAARATIRDELTDFAPRVRVEVVAPDEVAVALYDAALDSLSAGAPGECSVWMVDVERAAFVRKTV